MKGMTLEAITKACNGTFYGDKSYYSKEVASITTDSRNVEKDSLFVAIKGLRSDGHDYISSCLDKGALCCISERILTESMEPYIKVDSSLEAIKAIAAYYRQQLNIKVVGITGSVGKTSTKETIAAVLGIKYKVLKTLGNFNNELGLPLTIFRLTEDDEIAVLEMGISDFGEMSRLTAIAKPDICVITNIGLCHLENLKTRDGILKAKTEIFEGLNPEGIAVLNGDDDKLVTVSDVNGREPVFFGIDNKCSVYATDIDNLGLRGTDVTIGGLGDEGATIRVHIPVPGIHMVYNVCAAAAVGMSLKLTPEQIMAGVAELKTLPGRNHIIETDSFLILDDCYNANPVSMKASIDVIATAKGRKVCILGDMFELGEDEAKLHREVGEYIASSDIDVLITVGKLASDIARGAKDSGAACRIMSYHTKEELTDDLGHILNKGDNVLVKASHGMDFPKIVEAIKVMAASDN